MEVSVAKLIWVAQPLGLLPPTWLLPFSSATLSWVVGKCRWVSLGGEKKKKSVATRYYCYKKKAIIIL